MSARKLIVFGGNGFVGSEISRIATSRGWNVIVACRSGEPVGYQAREEWTSKVSFVKIDALQREQVYELLDDHPDTYAVINSIGMLTLDKRVGRRINGDPAINIAAALHTRPAIQKMVFVSAADMQPANLALSGYYYGKRNAEKAMLENIKSRSAILRPAFIHGPRALHNGITLPLQLVGRPLELLLKPISKLIPLTILTPPVSVRDVAQAAIHAAEDPLITGVFEYADIVKLSSTF